MVSIKERQKRRKFLTNKMIRIFKKHPHPKREKLSADDLMVMFDNSPLAVTGVRMVFPKIKCIEIAKPTIYNEIMKGEPCEWYPLMYHRAYPENTFAKWMVDTVNDVKLQTENKFKQLTSLRRECNGPLLQNARDNIGYLDFEEMKNICDWANSNQDKERTIIMYIDKLITIGVIATGGYSYDDKLKKYSIKSHPTFNMNPEDIAKYFTGTTERFEAIKHMFECIRKNRVNLFLLTTTSATHQADFDTTSHISWMLKYLRVLDPTLRENELIVGDSRADAMENSRDLMKLYGNLPRTPFKRPTTTKTIKKAKTLEKPKTIKKPPKPKPMQLKSTDRILFYDWYLKDINDMRKAFPQVKSLYAHDKPYNEILKGKPAQWYSLMYHRAYPENKYAKFIVDKMMDKEAMIKSEFKMLYKIPKDTSYGLTIDEMSKICEWAEQDKIFLYNWIGTVALTSVMNLSTINEKTKLFGLHPEIMKIPPLEIAKFVTGTKERFEAVKNMFACIRKKGTKVFLLSSNESFDWAFSYYDKSTVEFFLKLVQAVDPAMRKEDMIYGYTIVEALKKREIV